MRRNLNAQNNNSKIFKKISSYANEKLLPLATNHSDCTANKSWKTDLLLTNRSNTNDYVQDKACALNCSLSDNFSDARFRRSRSKAKASFENSASESLEWREDSKRNTMLISTPCYSKIVHNLVPRSFAFWRTLERLHQPRGLEPRVWLAMGFTNSHVETIRH